MQSSTRFTGRKLERWIRSFSPSVEALRVGLVGVAVDEVVDHADFVFDSEDVHRVAAQVLADGGNAVGLFDGEFRDAEVGAVRADKRDVGAVERGDEGQAAGIFLECRGHLAREQRRDGVGDRVVNVQQIELVGLGDVGHARGESEAVGRVLEQRIVGDFHLVVMDARNVRIEADRVRVGDEVDVVAARGEFEAELGSDDPAAAVGGIAGDADSHVGRLRGRGVGESRSTEGLRHKISCLVDVKEERVASAFAVIGDGHRFDRGPAADFEIVRDDPSAFLQRCIEDRAQL